MVSIIIIVTKFTSTFWPTIFFLECATTGFQVCLNCGTSPSCQSPFLSYPESIEATCASACVNDDTCDGAQYANETCSLYECAQPTPMPLSNSVFHRRTCAVNCKYVYIRQLLYVVVYYAIKWFVPFYLLIYYMYNNILCKNANWSK